MPPTFEFDPAKDAANLEKHGLSLALIQRAIWPPDLAAQDNRRDWRDAMVWFHPARRPDPRDGLHDPWLRRSRDQSAEGEPSRGSALS
jgi:hypothetical protein